MSVNPEPNIPLLRKCVEWAEAEAEKPLKDRQWEQGAYRMTPEALRYGYYKDSPWAVERTCGTAYCIAGYACHVSGLDWFDDLAEAALEEGNVPDEAAKLLGLTDDQSHELFFEKNTVNDVRRIAEKLAGERL